MRSLNQVFFLNEEGHRLNNEDSIYPRPGEATVKDKLFIVCDGVGGQLGGEAASSMACDSIAGSLLAISPENVTHQEILISIQNAKSLMQQYVIQHPKFGGMCTTLAMVYLRNNQVLIPWCGDSRIYHIRAGEILWHSKDHSLVQQLIDDGEISEEEAVNHPHKNIILNCVGPAKSLTGISFYQIDQISKGDFILLLTDGVLEQIDNSRLKGILGPSQKEHDKKKLFWEYCHGNTFDNFSMYLLHF